jgi:hypothetical protein
LSRIAQHNRSGLHREGKGGAELFFASLGARVGGGEIFGSSSSSGARRQQYMMRQIIVIYDNTQLSGDEEETKGNCEGRESDLGAAQIRLMSKVTSRGMKSSERQ